MKDGFIICCGLLLAGVVLQACFGPVRWDAFRWPVNGIVLAGFLTAVVLVFLLRRKVYGFQFVGTYMAAVPAMVCAVGLTIVMGLTRQTADGSWLSDMLSFWPFVLSYVYMDVVLGQVVLRRLRKMLGGQCSMSKDVSFLLNHLGLFLAMTTATLGNADVQRLKMVVTKGLPEWRALTTGQQVVQMPVAIELKDFIMESYDDGSPRRFASDIQVLTKTGKSVRATVDVNKPVEVDGWKIYQYGYDTQRGASSQTSILELVSDPWLPLVYIGICMMLAGAVCMFIGNSYDVG